MVATVAQRKDSKKHAPPKPGLHPHPATPSQTPPEKAKAWPPPEPVTHPPAPPVREERS